MEDEAMSRRMVLLCLGNSGLGSLLGDPLPSLLDLSIWAIPLQTLGSWWTTLATWGSLSVRALECHAVYPAFILTSSEINYTHARRIYCYRNSEMLREFQMLKESQKDANNSRWWSPFQCGPTHYLFLQPPTFPSASFLPDDGLPSPLTKVPSERATLASNYPQSPCCCLPWPAFIAPLIWFSRNIEYV